MTNEQSIFLVILGLCMVIFYKSNGRNIVKSGEELGNVVTLGKSKVNITKSEVRFTQVASLVVGIIFIIVGLVELLK